VYVVLVASEEWVRFPAFAAMKREIITLTNGKRVANFSSPHPFTFTDGSVLAAVTDAQSKWLQVTFHETELNDKGDVSLDFTLSAQVLAEMEIWKERHYREEVDVVFCCLPMITAIDRIFGRDYLLASPFRAVRMEDRIKKHLSINKQSI